MLVKIYRRQPPENSPQFAVVEASSRWGDERGGEKHAAWFLVGQDDLDRPEPRRLFDPDAARNDIASDGIHHFIHQALPTPVSAAEKTAIEAFALATTLPLVREVSQGIQILGTGTLFKHEDRYFIVTADHIFRTNEKDPKSPVIDLAEVAVPARPRQASLATLGKIEVWHPKSGLIDVAVVELLEPETIETLKRGWTFLPFSQVGRFDQHDRFIISGFLEEKAHLTDEILHQARLDLTTDLLDFDPEVEEPTPYDRFLYLDKEGIKADGARGPILSLKGMSGGPIWGFSIPSEGFWDPSRALRVVAVQSSELPQKWSRAMDWRAVREVLDLIDPAIS
ncbi:MAG TPA: hypothetical protein VN157_04400 [Caulobacter sp.]|nr:hypothetical protein [Caulobacter sp.]